ncbi:putative PRONE domain, Rop guanine nucleotide exchange factor [Helianthus annuus]|nr:putative PRONE domain, Rop guanine nucleotide exchange factor [Helianthus annuus]
MAYLKIDYHTNELILYFIEIKTYFALLNLILNVGHAILESYSRVLESLANTVMNRIEDVLYADKVAQDPSLLAKKRTTSSRVVVDESNGQVSGQTPTGSPKTLSDFMGWSVEQETTSGASSPQVEDKETEKYQSKSANILARKIWRN